MVGFEPLERLEFESVALAADFPPVLRDRNKQAVHSICCPEGCVHKRQDIVFPIANRPQIRHNIRVS